MALTVPPRSVSGNISGIYKTEAEARPDHFLSQEAAQATRRLPCCNSSHYWGVSVDEVVLIPNATTAVNTVLRNLIFVTDDLMLYFSTIYGACEKTIEHVWLLSWY